MQLYPKFLGQNIFGAYHSAPDRVPCHNPVNVTLHGDGGQGVEVPLALLVADSMIIREMCEGPELEKHITLVGVEVCQIEIYVKLLSSGEIKITDILRYSHVIDHSHLFSHVNYEVGTLLSIP